MTPLDRLRERTKDWLPRDEFKVLLTLEALARDEHHQRCGCTGEACKLGEVLRVLDGEG